MSQLLQSARLLLVYLHEQLASSRVRVLDMQPWLEQHGAHVECARYPPHLGERRRLARRAREFDLVLIQKKLPGVLDGVFWRRIERPLVFDFDDALPFRNRPEGGRWESSSRRRRFERALLSVDAVIAGNTYLASLVNQPEKPTLISPSPVPLPARPEALDFPIERRAQAAIGWIGGKGNLSALDDVALPLRKLARKTNFSLVVISDASVDLDGIAVEHVPWTLAGQERELARLDVGIMPLVDDPWSRGKCSYKLLQYMAVGVACVASPVGMNAELIEDGKNGLLADSAEEWEQALERLLADAELRRSLGRAGRRTVEEHYSYERTAERWAHFFHERIEAGSRKVKG